MEIEKFIAGRWLKQYQYQSFLPNPINHEWSWSDPGLNTLLEDASRLLGELSAYSELVPDVDLFVRMHNYKEADASSRIEGVRSTMETAVLPLERIEPERRDDWQEVQNYVQALNFAITELERLPLSSRMLREIHGILMQGVRGHSKAPGEFRRSQNWIGGSSLKEAVYVPPPHEEIAGLISDLERFWHNDSINVPHLIRIAISHYQFEAIHPFLDGNGRVGRLLITLYLVSNGLLARPVLHISSHIERYRGVYYDALTRVHASNDLLHWTRFFLVAVAETSRQGIETFRAILKLKAEAEARIGTMRRRAEIAQRCLKLLYSQPSVTVQEVAAALELPYAVANRLVAEFVRLQILVPQLETKRNRSYVFRDYLQLFLR